MATRTVTDSAALRFWLPVARSSTGRRPCRPRRRTAPRSRRSPGCSSGVGVGVVALRPVRARLAGGRRVVVRVGRDGQALGGDRRGVRAVDERLGVGDDDADRDAGAGAGGRRVGDRRDVAGQAGGDLDVAARGRDRARVGELALGGGDEHGGGDRRVLGVRDLPVRRVDVRRGRAWVLSMSCFAS